MERFSLTSLVSRRWWIILVLTAVVFFVASGVDGRKAPTYYGSFSVTVQANRNYPASNQLILQPGAAADTQGAVATVQSWVYDPYLVSKTLDLSNAKQDKNLKDLSKTFQIVTPVALSSAFQVQYAGASAEEVSTVFSSLKRVLTETKEAYNNKSSEIILDMTYTDATVSSVNPGLPVVPIAGLVVGLLAGFVIAALYDRAARR